jgi:GNAT superfamily N-acetyltransferase
MADPYTVSAVALDEIPDLFRRMHASEHWNECPDGPAAWVAHDPGCFLVGRLNGVPIATINAFRYRDSYGFIGCYWVAPEHRKKGYGLRLFRAALARLDRCNVGLFAVPAEVRQYEKSGFICEDACVVIYRGSAVYRPVPSRIVAYDEKFFDVIATYDRAVFPSERASFLRRWLAIPSFVVRVCVENGAVKGFAALRSGLECPEISPCFADSIEIALELVASLANEVPAGGTIGIVVHTGNPQAEAFFAGLAQYGLAPVTSCPVMHTQGPPKFDGAKVWSPTSLDVG